MMTGDREWRQKTGVGNPAQSETSITESPDLFEVFDIVQKLLSLRGVTDLAAHLKPTLKDLTNAFALCDMAPAVERLVKAFRGKEKICVYADFDLDGTSGCALLYQGLKSLGFTSVQTYQPSRMQEGYGFHAHAVEDLHAQGVSLILTVDVGITSFAACEKARELGVEVIITDHHQVGEKLPRALAVVNPNRPDCVSGLGYLSGAGVGFYLLRALKRGLVDQGLITPETGDLNSLLDYVALATITDMVPLVKDNRNLVYFGLKTFASTQRPGLVGLLETLDLLGRPLSAQDIGIRLAPKLNALSRLEMGLRPLDILLLQEPDPKMIHRVFTHNQDRVDLQNSGELKAMELWKEKKAREGVTPPQVVLASEEFHRGVVGLIATRMAAATGLPSFIGSISPEGTIVGSARRPNGSAINLVEALGSATEFLNRFGGHPAAAGFELGKIENLPHLDQALRLFFANENGRERAPRVDYDIEIPIERVDRDLMQSIENLGPFGVGFDVPVFRITGGVVASTKILKAAHLKIQLRSPSGALLEALWFSTPQLTEVVANLSPRTEVELIGELQWSYFGGKKSLQVVIQDLKTMDQMDRGYGKEQLQKAKNGEESEDFQVREGSGSSKSHEKSPQSR